LPALIDNLLSGTFRVECRARNLLEDNQLDQLDHVLDSFLSAISIGMFDPAQLIDVSTLVHPATEERRFRGRKFSAENLHPGAFRILKGMFAYFSAQSAMLDVYEARHVGSQGNLFSLAASYPPRIDPLPFHVELSELRGAAPTILIRVRFGIPPPIENRDDHIRAFNVWDNLLCGGFPPEGQPPGESGVGASETGFMMPTQLEHYIESHIADPQSLNPMLNMLASWSKKHPILQVDIE